MNAAAPLRCDVLVLGAGLAGMRAAWAAKQTAPRLRVLLVSPRRAASGSSFANRNNALGMQAPAPDQAEAFAAEAERLAPPGKIVPGLALAMAQDAPDRLADLLSLPLAFRRDEHGGLARFSGCFSPAPRAVIFDELAHAHAAFLQRARALGIGLLHGHEAVDLPAHANSGRVLGAVLRPLRGGPTVFVSARAVVAALGGPGPLFARRMCGPGGSGLALGLLRRAGAELINARWLQFFWLRTRDGSFVNPGDLSWPSAWEQLAKARRGHCPVGWNLPDTALDLALLSQGGARGGGVRLPDGGTMALYAHAGNGGARIDAHGRTSVPGLYACGECAGGMHGANRMGGGMVLAALAFGARAGAAAAEAAAKLPRSDAGGPAFPIEHDAALPADAAFVRRLRRGMSVHALPGADCATRAALSFSAWLEEEAARAASLRQRLLARSALCVLHGE
jgi:L-aspartate oxidase